MDELMGERVDREMEDGGRYGRTDGGKADWMDGEKYRWMNGERKGEREGETEEEVDEWMGEVSIKAWMVEAMEEGKTK